ncbi:MAG: hypothetical protein H6773_01610 [Pseudomonadales bacterium]|nr:hypothetical protein [Candidatus Woesebacteria bacterium]MCB9800853.1 hypothetical protein [Pseudomonadales bacterium]
MHVKKNLEYQPRHRSQFDILNHYRNRLDALSPDKKARIKPISILEGDSPVRGFRIQLSNPESPKKGLITDWDDTLENYSSRKAPYFQALYKRCATTKLSPVDFTAMCKALNRAGRVLNWQDIHPESYSPFLEMLAETQLIDDLTSGVDDETFLNFLQVPSEALARTYLLEKVIPLLGDMVTPKHKGEKTYFAETHHQSLAHTLEEKHPLIADDVWDAYQQHMTRPNLSKANIALFDLDPSVYWAISTFGAIEFQAKKIISSLELLKAQGKRIPDEIMIITHGRKQQALLQIMDEHPETEWTYVDDSERQLASLHEERPQIHAICAKLSGTKRVDEPSNYPTTEMTDPLSMLINSV